MWSTDVQNAAKCLAALQTLHPTDGGTDPAPQQPIAPGNWKKEVCLARLEIQVASLEEVKFVMMGITCSDGT